MTIINNNLVTIDTVVPALSIGHIQLSADRRSTGTTKLTDAQRIRRVVLPNNHWGDFTASLNGAMSQGLTDILRGALVTIGSDRLRDTLTSTPDAKTVELTDFTVSALLTWNNETASGRGSITFTREQVEAWIATSHTMAAFKLKHADKPQLPQLVALLTTRFATLAAKNHGLKEPSDVAKLMALIDSQDLEGDNANAALATEIITRLDHISKTLTAKQAEATVSMDDL